MGAYFGPEGVALATNAENPKGFWERRDVLSLNDRILAHYGSLWFDVFPLSAAGGAHHDGLPAGLAGDLASFVHGVDAFRPWFLKDPRFCLTLPCWKPLLDRPVAVVCSRSPQAVIASLLKRDLLDIELNEARATSLWEIYTSSMLDATADMPRVFVGYEDLLAAPYAACERLFADLERHGVRGLAMPSPDEVHAFVDPGLQRSVGRSTEISERMAELDAAGRGGSVEPWHRQPQPEALETARRFNVELEEVRCRHYLLRAAAEHGRDLEHVLARRTVAAGSVKEWTLERLAQLARGDA